MLKSCLSRFFLVSAVRRRKAVGKEEKIMPINILPKKQQPKPPACKKAKKAKKVGKPLR